MERWIQIFVHHLENDFIGSISVMNRETRWILLAATCLAAISRLPVEWPESHLCAAEPQTLTVPALPGSGSGFGAGSGGYVGAGSCAAASCHGGESGLDRNEPKKLSEYAVWIQNDPHATAYTALYNRRSRQIAHNLGLKEPAHRSAVCVNCHSLAADPPADAIGAGVQYRHTLEDGVSCEACHGPAAGWLSEHTTAGWKNRSADQKAALGFRNTKDVQGRTAACVKCHVGGEGRDVDHDLIAAGHPRLYFEMAAYQEKMPRHWSRKTDQHQNQASEARLWIVGQLTAAAGAIDLLEYRASGRKPNGVWPEFAESACFACHHDLSRPGPGGPNWRQARQNTGRADDFPWGTWHFALVGEITRALPAAGDGDGLNKSLRQLRQVMAKPDPDRAAVRMAASDLRLKLKPFAAHANGHGPFSDVELRDWLRMLVKTSDSPAAHDWDGTTQVYLGLVAVAQTLRESPSGGLSIASQADVFNQLRGIRDRLQFPRADVRIQYSSPSDFDEQRIEQLTGDLQRLRELIDSN